MTDFITAVLNREFEKATDILEKNRNVMNDKDNQHDTAIIIASREGKTDVVDFLIKNGADLNDRGTIGYTPLMLAAEEGHTDTAKLLIDKGADIHLINNPGNNAIIIII